MPDSDNIWISANEIRKVIDMPSQLDYAIQKLGGAKKGICRTVAPSIAGGNGLQIERDAVREMLDRGLIALKSQPVASGRWSVKTMGDPAGFIIKYGLKI